MESLNGQVFSMRLDSWDHQHNCYVCKKEYDCTWNYCKDQRNRCCSECIKHFQAQSAKETPDVMP